MTPGADAFDTSDEARDIQFALWRAMTAAEKWKLADDLCATVDQLARAGIRRDHPGASEHEILWHLAARRYGTETADAAFPQTP